ncbi:MAG: M48 family metalloprotease, partial [Acidobacteria bacterium]|nr:M48 family metalloprotease [Acidobacteriota bacterium]
MQFGFPRPGRKKRGARSLLAVFCVAFPPGAAPVPGPIVPAQNGPQTTCAPLPLLPRGFHLPRGVSPLGPSSFTLLDESEMGTQAVILQEGKSPSVRDERIERIGRSVARYCDRPQMRFDFRVLPGADEANAFSLVGGHVYVTRDLLEKYTLTDDELAFALGHEIAHAAFRDIPNSIVDQAVARYVDHALCERLGAGSAEYQTASRALQAEIDALIQRRELNADQFGMLYALRAGYHSDGAVTFLEKLREAIGPRVEVPVHPGSFPLHPEIPVRLEEVRKGLSQLAFAANKFDAGYRALHEGDFNLAINTFEELTDVFPQSQNALVNLGAAYHGKY